MLIFLLIVLWTVYPEMFLSRNFICEPNILEEKHVWYWYSFNRNSKYLEAIGLVLGLNNKYCKDFWLMWFNKDIKTDLVFNKALTFGFVGRKNH